MTNSKGIIFAADIIEKSKLFATIKEVSQYIEAIKIGDLVLYEHGWKIVNEIKRITNLPLIADLKLMDIPEIAERVTKSAVEAGADGIIVCGIAGGDTIDACIRSMGNKMVFVFTEFTHCGGLITKEMANEYIDIAVTLGCVGIQVPGTKEERIKEVREKVGNDLIIICCGIGSQYPCNGRSERINFGSAIAAGADYEIIGRSIYSPLFTNTTPSSAAKQIKEKILEVLKNEKSC